MAASAWASSRTTDTPAETGFADWRQWVFDREDPEAVVGVGAVEVRDREIYQVRQIHQVPGQPRWTKDWVRGVRGAGRDVRNRGARR